VTPQPAHDGVAGVEVRINGTPLSPQMAAHLSEVRVQDNLMLPDAFLIRIADPDLTHMDDAMFEIGNEVDILFADPAAGSLKTVTAGQIAALEPEFAAGGAYVALRGYDRSHALHRTRRTQTYQNCTADDVARKVTGQAGLTPGTIDPAGAPEEFMQQTNETDWEFLWRLASKIDFEVVVVGDHLHFRRAGGAADSDPISLRWGERLTAFRPRVTGVQQVDEVVVRGWDPHSRQTVEASAQPTGLDSSIGMERGRAVAALGGGTATIADRPVGSQAEAQALARSVAARLGNAFIEAEGASHGDPRLKAGCKVQVQGIGDRFSGTYSLSSTTHIFRGVRGYETQFVVSGRVPRGLVDLATPAARRSWGDSGVVGIVTQNQDPDGLGRVRVKYPALGDQTEGWWARIASPSAGDGRGMMMMPVAGDEVLIVFEHGDVRRPIVIGSMFNGKSKPQSLSQSDGSFALGSQKAVAITAAEGVTVKSGKQLQISSGADMQVSADRGAVTITAQTSVTIKAPSITLQADGAIQISGSQVSLGLPAWRRRAGRGRVGARGNRRPTGDRADPEHGAGGAADAPRVRLRNPRLRV
jgi:phage protein D